MRLEAKRQGSAEGTRVIVVLAVYKPDPQFFDEQIASLEAQTHANLFLVLVDADVTSGHMIDTRLADSVLAYQIATPEAPYDSYQAFEFGLQTGLDLSFDGDVFALCDQDDVWHPERIERTLAALDLQGADLAHSDARVVDAQGRVRHGSLFRSETRLSRTGLRGLLLRNNVTGMTCLMSRKLVQSALPFPSQAAVFFHHDLWLALVATAMRGVIFVDRALVDYRQHGSNAVGALDGSAQWVRPGSAVWRRRRAGDYFIAGYLAKCLYLRMTDVAEIDAAAVNQRALGTLAPYLAIRGTGATFLGDALVWALRGRFALAGRALTFSLLRLARLGWAVKRCIRAGLVPELADFDRKGFSLAPGVQPGLVAEPKKTGAMAQVVNATTFTDPRVSPKFRPVVEPAGDGGLVVLLPTLNPTEIFAGIATAIDIGVGLAASGVPVTLIACDLPVASMAASRAFVARRAHSSGAPPDALDRLRLVCGVTSARIVFGRKDRFLATAWWSAHVARHLILQGGFTNPRFYYLIQDFEPNFYPWGDECAAAMASYAFDYTPIFNSTLLRDYFAAQNIGPRGAAPLAFCPAIDIAHYSGLKRHTHPIRRLALYGRPEVSRNLFPTAVQALEKFLTVERLSSRDIDLVSVGLPHPDVRFSRGQMLRSCGKIPWADYPKFLSGVDVGLSLMLSPHPSHLPIEMAAAGARVVTNGFGGKDLSTLSSAIQSSDPDATSLAAALSTAWHAPKVSAQERQIDLGKLGAPLSEVVSALAAELAGTALLLRKSA